MSDESSIEARVAASGSLPNRQTAEDETVAAVATRLGTHSGIYLADAVGSLILALVYIVILTRFLDPDEFGRLALLLVFASLLTVLYNLPTLQGTLQYVYGSAGDLDVEDDEDGGTVEDKERALGTGLLLTVLIATGGTVVAAAAAPLLASAVHADRVEIVLAAASGGLGAIGRLMIQVNRLERRPGRYAILDMARPLLIMAAAGGLVGSGFGVKGAIGGIAIGTAVSTIVSMIGTKSTYRLAFSREDARGILGTSTPLYPIITSYWVIGNVDVLMVSYLLSTSEAGVYRLGSRIGGMMAYFTSAFLQAWGPLRGTSAFEAIDQRHGVGRVGGGILTYFFFAALGLLLALVVGADLLVRVAPGAYADAAPIIPLVGAGYLVHGLLIVVNRSATFPKKRFRYRRALLTGVAAFLATGFILIPRIGASGGALAVVAGFLVPLLLLGLRSQRGDEPLEVHYLQLAAALTIAGTCAAAALLLAPLAGAASPCVDLAALLAYPLLLVALGVVPRDHVKTMRAVLSDAARPPGKRRLREAVMSLDQVHREALRLACQRGDIAEVADGLDVDQAEAARRVGEAVRAVAATRSASPERVVRRVRGLGAEVDLHVELGSYLFSTRSRPERDLLAKDLWSSGIEPSELHSMEITVEALKKATQRAWRDLDDRAS